ncbi:MAG: pentapeptide repeat-containing protein [Beijerinckiaceae bacterium]
MDYAEAVAADLRATTLANAWARNAKFTGSQMNGVTFHGGKFKFADFQGADLSGAKTERGYIGAGTSDEDSESYSDYDYQQLLEPGQVDDFKPVFEEKNSGNDALELAGIKTPQQPDNYLVDFTGAHFNNADLRGADLRNSNIKQEQVNDACTDSTSLLPDKNMRTECASKPWVDNIREAFRSVAQSNYSMADGCTAALRGALK